jgi:uncharacterized protein
MTMDSRPLALITGASSGIGEQFARRYAREGFDLVLVGRSGAVLHALAAELSASHSVSAEAHVADLSNETDTSALSDRITRHLPRIDHLVNCAGVAPEGDLANADDDDLRQMIALNVTALTLLTRAAIIRMRGAGHGTIINIASAAAYQPMPHMAAYAASKSYVLMLTEAMHEENRSHGLRILAVSPGDTDTPMNTGAAKNKRKPEQVVETAFAALVGTASSVVDGRANAILATISSRVIPKRFGLRTAEKMMREKA